jgi:membrane protein YqaA with SNARE-associated domain
VLTWLVVALLVAVGSALFPPLSVELFVVTLAARHPQYPALLLGAVIAIGQVAGKLLYFYAGRGDLHLPAFLHPKPKPDRQRPETGPLRAWHVFANWCKRGWAWLRVKCHAHPGWMIGATASSALIGVPPFMATTVLAGLAGLSLRTFILAALPARFIRFAVLAASPTLVVHLWPGLRHGHHWHWIHVLVH